MSFNKLARMSMDNDKGGDGIRRQQRARHQHRGGAEQSVSELRVRLSSVKIGSLCRVCSVRIHGVMRRRLMDLGLVPDAEVLVLRTAPLNDPIEVRVDNAYVALRREEADSIEVIVL